MGLGERFRGGGDDRPGCSGPVYILTLTLPEHNDYEFSRYAISNFKPGRSRHEQIEDDFGAAESFKLCRMRAEQKAELKQRRVYYTAGGLCLQHLPIRRPKPKPAPTRSA